MREPNGFFTHKYETTIVSVGTLNLSAFDELNFGNDARNLKITRLDNEPIPSNFGYDKNATMLETYDFATRYLLTCQADRTNFMVVPENIRFRFNYYEGFGYSMLQNDVSVSELYVGGGFEVWKVSD